MQEVAYNLKERVRQELAFPAVVHFYSWLLQGTVSLLVSWSQIPLQSACA